LEDERGALEHEQKGGPKADNAQQPPTAAIIPEGEAPGRQTTTAESESEPHQAKDKLDRDLVRWTRVLAFFTGALVLAAGLQFWAMRGQLSEMKTAREGGEKSMVDQLAAMNGQLAQMRIAQRPWIKPVVLTPTWGVVNSTEVAFGVEFRIKNIGSSPALHVSAAIRLVVPQRVPFRNGNLLMICQEIIPRSGPDVMLFPHEETTIRDGELPIVIKTDQQEILNRLRNHPGEQGQPYTAFDIQGCVTYSSAEDNQIYYTAFDSDLSKIGPNCIDPAASWILSARSLLPASWRRSRWCIATSRTHHESESLMSDTRCATYFSPSFLLLSRANY
jgi:hypothetical protein